MNLLDIALAIFMSCAGLGLLLICIVVTYMLYKIFKD